MDSADLDKLKDGNPIKSSNNGITIFFMFYSPACIPLGNGLNSSRSALPHPLSTTVKYFCASKG